MNTLVEIVAAVRRLVPAQFDELRREIERVEKDSRAIRFEAREPGDIGYRLVRLADGELWELLRRRLAIKERSLGVRWLLYGPSAPLRLDLPAAYLALKHLSGESGRHFDDRECSFSFPFALDVEREGRTFPYLLEVRNYGGALEFPIRRVVGGRDRRLAEDRCHDPFEREFGEEEIQRFLLRFVLRLMDLWRVIRRRHHEPFVQTVARNQVVFGCCEGKVFGKWYQREMTYTAALRRYEDQVRREQVRADRRAPRKSVAHTPRAGQ